MKKLFLPIIIIILLISGVWYYKKINFTKVNPNITSYRNNNLGISFKYQKTLTTKGDNLSIKIHHEVPFEHHDFCDFKGDATTTIPTLTDFNIEMHLSTKNLVDTMRIESPYIPEENFLDNKIVPSPGFIDPVDFGNLKGYSIFEGAEGCGHTIYYLEVSPIKTLVITNDLITIFSGSIDKADVDEALKVPNVINADEANSIFDSIIKSLVVQ